MQHAGAFVQIGPRLLQFAPAGDLLFERFLQLAHLHFAGLFTTVGADQAGGLAGQSALVASEGQQLLIREGGDGGLFLRDHLGGQAA